MYWEKTRKPDVGSQDYSKSSSRSVDENDNGFTRAVERMLSLNCTNIDTLSLTSMSLVQKSYITPSLIFQHPSVI